MNRPWYIYIMTNEQNGTLYVWVTSNLLRRIYEHKEWIIDGFTKKYGLKTCVYYEYYEEINTAITREKQIKNGNRKQKLELIESINPEWNYLTETIKDRI
jgi:putative endonuclease